MPSDDFGGEEDPHFFVEVDEDDAFDVISMKVVLDEEGNEIMAGAMEATPGRYELRRVRDDTE